MNRLLLLAGLMLATVTTSYAQGEGKSTLCDFLINDGALVGGVQLTFSESGTGFGGGLSLARANSGLVAEVMPSTRLSSWQLGVRAMFPISRKFGLVLQPAFGEILEPALSNEWLSNPSMTMGVQYNKHESLALTVAGRFVGAPGYYRTWVLDFAAFASDGAGHAMLFLVRLDPRLNGATTGALFVSF